MRAKKITKIKSESLFVLPVFFTARIIDAINLLVKGMLTRQGEGVNVSVLLVGIIGGNNLQGYKQANLCRMALTVVRIVRYLPTFSRP